MKRATIRQRRTLSDGSRLVCIVCPVCDRRHWVSSAQSVGRCPRKPGQFTLESDR